MSQFFCDNPKCQLHFPVGADAHEIGMAEGHAAVEFEKLASEPYSEVPMLLKEGGAITFCLNTKVSLAGWRVKIASKTLCSAIQTQVVDGMEIKGRFCTACANMLALFSEAGGEYTLTPAEDPEFKPAAPGSADDPFKAFIVEQGELSTTELNSSLTLDTSNNQLWVNNTINPSLASAADDMQSIANALGIPAKNIAKKLAFAEMYGAKPGDIAKIVESLAGDGKITPGKSILEMLAEKVQKTSDATQNFGEAAKSAAKKIDQSPFGGFGGQIKKDLQTYKGFDPGAEPAKMVIIDSMGTYEDAMLAQVVKNVKEEHAKIVQAKVADWEKKALKPTPKSELKGIIPAYEESKHPQIYAENPKDFQEKFKLGLEKVPKHHTKKKGQK